MLSFYGLRNKLYGLDARRRNPLFIILICLGYAVVWFVPHYGDVTLCLFKNITGVPCPGCGGMRATNALMSLDIKGALAVNPLSVAVNLAVLALVPFAAADAVRNEDLALKFIKRPMAKWVIVILAVAVLAQWIWNVNRMI